MKKSVSYAKKRKRVREDGISVNKYSSRTISVLKKSLNFVSSVVISLEDMATRKQQQQEETKKKFSKNQQILGSLHA